jgi:hypothetical protein
MIKIRWFSAPLNLSKPNELLRTYDIEASRRICLYLISVTFFRKSTNTEELGESLSHCRGPFFAEYNLEQNISLNVKQKISFRMCLLWFTFVTHSSVVTPIIKLDVQNTLFFQTLCSPNILWKFNYFHTPTYALVSYIIKSALIIYIKTLYSLIAPT